MRSLPPPLFPRKNKVLTTLSQKIIKKEQPDRDYINVNDRAQDMQKGRKTRPYMLFGAEDGTRTRNVQLGKLTLYR